MPRPHPETMKKGEPQITQIFLFFLRVPSCNFVANFLVIFIGVDLEPAGGVI